MSRSWSVLPLLLALWLSAGASASAPSPAPEGRAWVLADADLAREGLRTATGLELLRGLHSRPGSAGPGAAATAVPWAPAEIDRAFRIPAPAREWVTERALRREEHLPYYPAAPPRRV